MTHTKFENFDDKTQTTIDKTLSTINNVWHTWFPSSTSTSTSTSTGTGTGTGTPAKLPPSSPNPEEKPKYRGLIYGGIGLGVLGVGFLIYKKMKKK